METAVIVPPAGQEEGAAGEGGMRSASSSAKGGELPDVRRRKFLPSLIINVTLPLSIYYTLRSQGVPPWLGLLLGGGVPVLRAAYVGIRYRRIESIDVCVVGLYALSAATSLISGNPRVMLLKDVLFSLLLGLWILSTLRFGKPFAFEFAQSARSAANARKAQEFLDESRVYNRAVRKITILWGGSQVFDAVVAGVVALTVPIDLIPLVGRVQSLTVVTLAGLTTFFYQRRFRATYGMGLFGNPTGKSSAGETELTEEHEAESAEQEEKDVRAESDVREESDKAENAESAENVENAEDVEGADGETAADDSEATEGKAEDAGEETTSEYANNANDGDDGEDAKDAAAVDVTDIPVDAVDAVDADGGDKAGRKTVAECEEAV